MITDADPLGVPMKQLLFLCMLSGLLQSMTLEALLEHAKTHALALKPPSTQRDIAQSKIHNASLFENPTIALSINDMWATDPLNRSLEPMQTQAITLSQRLPFFGKRALKEAASTHNYGQTQHDYHTALQALLLAITRQGIEYWRHETLIDIYKRYIALEQQSIELFEAYAATQDNFHAAIVSAQLNLSKLRIAQREHTHVLTQVRATLSYLSSLSVDVISYTPKPWVLPSLSHFTTESIHAPLLQGAQDGLYRAQKEHALASKSLMPDPLITASWAHRSAFEDYFSFGVAMAVPLYGNEALQIEQTKLQALFHEQKLHDATAKINEQIHILYAKLQISFDTHEILSTQSLPHIAHMFEVAHAKIKAGGDLLKYIDILDKKLDIEAQLLNTQADFYQTWAALDALIGAL